MRQCVNDNDDYAFGVLGQSGLTKAQEEARKHLGRMEGLGDGGFSGFSKTLRLGDSSEVSCGSCSLSRYRQGFV